jgi:hypothetical protein
MSDVLSHNNIVIFSQPRSGTKLLAKILENFGYHNYGEWYALTSAYIENNKAIRREIHLNEILPTSEKQYKKIKEHMRRFSLYNKVGKNVITIWPESLLEFPFMLAEYDSYHWVCIRRDPWEQMLSWYISAANKNFDGLFESRPICFNEDFFKKSYWDYYKVCEMQDWILKTKSATMLNFDELITEKSTNIGKTYIVNSKDEHLNLEVLVQNIDEVRFWFNKCEQIRLSDTNYFL